MSDIAETLQQRDATHGDYAQVSTCAQALKNVMRSMPGWHDAPSRQREALDMIALKMSRIVCGSANFHDHWHDIEGYARLVAVGLKGGAA